MHLNYLHNSISDYGSLQTKDFVKDVIDFTGK